LLGPDVRLVQEGTDTHLQLPSTSAAGNFPPELHGVVGFCIPIVAGAQRRRGFSTGAEAKRKTK